MERVKPLLLCLKQFACFINQSKFYLLQIDLLIVLQLFRTNQFAANILLIFYVAILHTSSFIIKTDWTPLNKGIWSDAIYSWIGASAAGVIRDPNVSTDNASAFIGNLVGQAVPALVMLFLVSLIPVIHKRFFQKTPAVQTTE